jgi:mRNA-degrading endonuclease RelE of RelBE toxin-antitoxin system
MSYKVNYTAKARKDLKNLPPDVAQRIILSINGIRDDPYSCQEDQRDETHASALHPPRR